MGGRGFRHGLRSRHDSRLWWSGLAGLLVLATAPALANTAMFNLSMLLGTVTTTGGTVQLPATADSVAGSGVRVSAGMVRRGQILVNRSTMVTAWATIVSAPANLTCGNTSVPASFALDAANCSTPAVGTCLIYVGVTLDVPNALLSGDCTAPALTIQVNFN